jgi:hypothetical protein
VRKPKLGVNARDHEPLLSFVRFCGDAPANVFPARNRDYGSAVRTFRIMRSGDRCGTVHRLISGWYECCLGNFP